jgi:U3 small nucleolar RNA-associated protein 23
MVPLEPQLLTSALSRKLMHQYELNFSFREPYQVLCDSTIVQDASRFKIDLPGRLQQVLQGTIKPMITQCDMRHLYSAEPKDEETILKAKEFERRRCNHHELENPLSTEECLKSVVDPKGSLTNKNRYVVATQDPEVRAHFRKIPGVPLVYINKSVMILEPMASATEQQREQVENGKFKAGLKSRRASTAGQKRKHDEEDEKETDVGRSPGGGLSRREKKKARGPKAPNPLSMMKSKKTLAAEAATAKAEKEKKKAAQAEGAPATDAPATPVVDDEESRKRKRRRKHKKSGEGGGADGVEAQTDDVSPISDDL